MNLRTIVAVGLAALLVSTGMAVAAPGNAPDDAGPSDDSAGPPDDLPGPVPDFVSDIHDAIQQFLDGGIDSLGETVSDITPGNESDGGDADGASG